MGRKKPGTSGVIEAAGGLLWRETSRGREIAIVHRTRYDDWSLPKGWREKGEEFIEAAKREVIEETNCKVKMGEFAGSTSYVVNGVPKIVLFWHMTLIGKCGFVPNNEVDTLEWVDVEQALSTLDYEDERLLVTRVSKDWK
jgi:8-oxo-dGTP diphosphatase